MEVDGSSSLWGTTTLLCEELPMHLSFLLFCMSCSLFTASVSLLHSILVYMYLFPFLLLVIVAFTLLSSLSYRTRCINASQLSMPLIIYFKLFNTVFKYSESVQAVEVLDLSKKKVQGIGCPRPREHDLSPLARALDAGEIKCFGESQKRGKRP